MEAILQRLQEGKKTQTIGDLSVWSGDSDIFHCYTLELPDKGNQRRISRIPAGEYIVKKRYSKKYKWHFHIQDVPNRDFILIHHGNYYTDILGCVLVGSDIVDINKDGHVDVIRSKSTMKDLLEILPQEFKLTIKDA